MDTAEPAALHGTIQPVPEGDAQPFADKEALLALLHQLILEQVLSHGGQHGSDGETLGVAYER